MLEISPVLAGTFDKADYIPAASNIASAGNAPAPAPADNAAEVSGADSRRYTKFDHSASDVASVTDFKFSDLLDILNPLQHIPLVSDAYRAITGDEIRPFARVAGDMLYGGLLGGASAVMGGVGAIADATLEQETGKDSGSTLIAALFGPGEKPAEVQVASADSAEAPAPAAAPVETVETAEDKSDAEISAAAAAVTAPAPSAPAPPAPAAAVADASASGTIPLTAGKAFPLKQPFGGVMAPARTAEQNMAMALSAAAPGMRLGHTIYTSPLMNGPKPLKLQNSVTAPAAAPASAPAPSPAPSPAANAQSPAAAQISAQALPQHNPLPPELMNDMMLKALSQYRNVAGGQSVPGGVINLTN